jgi:hypothetical protein
MACGVAAAGLVLTISISGAQADPADDALAKLNELSQQALQAREAVTAAEENLEAKEAEQASAADQHRADLEALAAANSELEPHQAAVDRLAAATYMSGRTGQMAAVLTAASPQQLIDRLSLQRTVTGQMTAQLDAFRSTRERAAAASEKSAELARVAAEQAAAERTALQAKWKELLKQIAAAEAQYAALTPQQQAMVDAVPPPAAQPAPPAPEIIAMPGPPAEAPPPEAPAFVDIPEALPVGVASEAGLQPNTILAARAVSAQFPQIREIGGVRPDSKPWHPSGLAIDIMIPNPYSPEGIALGDQILAFALANAARFNLQDAIWRGTYYTPAGPQGSGYGHYDHVHLTTRR